MKPGENYWNGATIDEAEKYMIFDHYDDLDAPLPPVKALLKSRDIDSFWNNELTQACILEAEQSEPEKAEPCTIGGVITMAGGADCARSIIMFCLQYD